MSHPVFVPPAGLAEIIAVHRDLFGGFTMMADAAGADGDGGPAAGTDAGKTSGDQQPPAFQAITSAEALQAEIAKATAPYADYDQLKEQAGKWAAAEDAQKTELQKTVERAEKAEKALAQAQAVALRAEVAAAEGLDPSLAGRLQGNSREELVADAKALAQLVRPQKTPGLRFSSGGGDGAGGSKDDAARVFFGL